MTINLEELKKDREAGTPGEWLYKYTRLGHTVRQSEASNALIVANNMGNPEPDARRIARVPALEEMLLEAVELLKYYASASLDKIPARNFLERLK